MRRREPIVAMCLLVATAIAMARRNQFSAFSGAASKGRSPRVYDRSLEDTTNEHAGSLGQMALDRRSALLVASLAAVPVTLQADPATAVVQISTRYAKGELRAALGSLRELKAKWDKVTPDDLRTLLISAGVDEAVTIDVPPGSALGVELEGLVITDLTKNLGFRVGDFVEEVNGVPVENIQDLRLKVKDAPPKDILKVTVRRRSTTPFVTFEQSVKAIYGDADYPLPEPDEDVIPELKALQAGVDSWESGFVTKEELLARLDALCAAIAPYIGDAPAAKAPAPASAPPPAPEADLSGLFD